MRGAHGLALPAPQAVLDGVGDAADFGLLEDQALRAEQIEARRVGSGQIGTGQQLAAVEASFRINLALVVDERCDFCRGQVFEFGDADAVLAGNDAIEAPRQGHDPRDSGMCLAQHRVVVGIHWNVAVHVAIARMHVQRDEYTRSQHVPMHVDASLEDRREGHAGENVFQGRLDLGLPRHDDRMVLQRRKRLIDADEQILPSCAHRGDDRTGFVEFRRQGLRRRQFLGVGAPQPRREGLGKRHVERVAQRELVADRQLDVDPLDAVGIVAQTIERNHDIFVDLERVGMRGDRCGAGSVQPEFLAGLG